MALYLHALTNRLKQLYLLPAFLFLTISSASAQVSVNQDTAAINKSIEQGQLLVSSNTDSAIVIFEKALKQSEQIAFANGVKSSLFYLANLYADKGNYAQCLSMFQEAMAVCEKDPRMVKVLASVYNGLAKIYQTQSNNKDAAKYYYKAILIAEKYLSDKELCTLYNNFGSLLINIGNFAQALYYVDKAEKLAYQAKNYNVLSLSYINKGNIYNAQNEYPKSLAYFKEALTLANEHHIPRLQSLALTNIGNAYHLMKLPLKAAPYLEKAIALKEDIDPFFTNMAVTMLGEVYYELHDYKKAETYLLKSINTAQSLSIGRDLIEAHQKLAEIYAATGRYKEAYIQQSYSKHMQDSIRNNDADNTISKLEVKYRTAEKDKDIIKKQLLISQQENNLKRKNLWLGIISFGLLSLLALSIGSYRINRHKQNLHNKQTHMLLQEKEIGQLKAMVNGEEKERARIALEIHDGIMSQLMAVKFNVDMLQSLKDRLIAPDELSNVASQLDDATKELRKTAHNLSPDLLLQEGLATAILVFCDTIEASTGIDIDFQMYGTIPRFDKEIELSVYRMVQELMQNVMKHAKAMQIIVQLSYRNETLSTAIDDNGQGFSLENVGHKGKGLNNIRSRIKALNGQLDIISNEGKGTSIHMEFNIKPIENTATV